jgi:hypothetical protein
MKYSLEVVSDKPDLWKDGDPVRPMLGVTYKTYPGREVFGLRDESGEYVSFCCVARTWDVPVDIISLSRLTSEDGSVCVPYTVWSLRKGAGRSIIKELLKMLSSSELGIKRVVTLSPKTEMARKFHLKNGAREISVNVVTANFEYDL